MTMPNTSFTFSYIVVDQKSRDKQGQPVLGIYTFLTKNANDMPIKVLQSSLPSITAKIYAGIPYPNFDFTAAIERRVKLDIQRRYDYEGVVAGQINDKEWHLDMVPTISKLEL